MCALRDLAASTAPPDAKKRKIPDDLLRALEGLTRSFYVVAEAAPNTNKAKAAMSRILAQILAPWAAETTVKTKMQQHNSRVTAELTTERGKLTELLSATSASRGGSKAR